MPFNELQRRDSWPPTILRINEDETDTMEAIDENPFSFFLTSPEDIDDTLEDISAGIEEGDEPRPRVRTISPSALQRAPMENESHDAFGLGMPFSLRDFTMAHTKGRELRGVAKREHPVGLGISGALPEFSARGRAPIRLTPSRSGKGRGQTRSLSARRPHSWRAPSPDIGSIQEERESDDGDDSKVEVKAASTQRQETSPAAVVEVATPPKKKKRVHWAL